MNIEQVRADIIDVDKKIFLDSAGSSLVPKAVSKSISTYLEEEAGYGGYLTSDNHEDTFEEFYTEAAKLINAKPRNIAFTHDATDSYIKALSSVDFNPDDIIITTDLDYGSNQIQFLSLQKRFGIQIKRIKTFENGDLDLNNFEQLIDIEKPKLVAVTHIPTNSGQVQDVQAIGKICHANSILFLLDACQSIGQLHVDVQDIKCDFLSATGRKFLRGPRGTGFLHVSDSVLDGGLYPLFIDGRGAEWIKKDEYSIEKTAKRYETWEKPYALKLGLIEALKYLNNIGIKEVQSYNSELMKYFRNEISAISGIKVYDRGSVTCNILSFTKLSRTLEDIQSHLKSNDVIFSVSDKHWGVIDFENKNLEWVIRLSPHYFNTKEEIVQVLEILDGM